MRRLPSRIALLAGLFASGLPAQEPGAIGAPRILAPVLEGSPAHGIAGARAGSECWIVHFATRSFDLTAVREAIRTKRPAAEIDRLLADVDRRMRTDQAAFVASVERAGGRVVRQWWIVNAAAVEVTPAQLAAVRALPNVRFVQPDVACSPSIKKATNANNHDADVVQSWGFNGQGATVAIIDTGHDQNMNNSGRPHRTYFVNGNPANPSGGGIGGSRLLINRQVGTMPADDVHGHGTLVASIAAGENWGIPEADRGHAPRAGIAGYAIANDVMGNSTYGTLATAWQHVVTDRSTFGTVAANISYAGNPNPLSVEQQALDSAAVNFDLLCCVSAGNFGSDTTASQSAVNGLAVGAVAADSHQVWANSGAGPISGDPTRTYPDLVACGVTVDGAAHNQENAWISATGTSFAAPQVTGAATQLRARFPQLTAVQTKAVLLASSADVGAQNPGLGPNSFGMGMLKNDRAHRLAASNNFGSGSVTTGTPHVVDIPVVAGRTYSIAIAWHRYDLASTGWSNLDLVVKNPSTSAVLGIAISPRNLYEMVRVTPTFTGALRLETTAVSLAGLGGGPQPFSWAWTDNAAARRDVVAYGNGCSGAGHAITIGTVFNPGAGALTSTNPILGEYAFRFPSLPQSFEGVEVFAKCSQHAVTANVSIRAVNGITGQPDQFTSLGTGRLTAGSSPGWCRALFPSTVTVSGDFYVCIETVADAIDVELAGGGSLPTSVYSRSAFLFGPWQSTFVNAVSLRTLDRNPFPGGSPHFRVEGQDASSYSLPPLTFGTTTQLKVSEAMPNSIAISLIGFSETNLNLAPFGAPVCTLLSSAEILTAAFVNATGDATTLLPLTTVTDAHYLEIYGQFAVLDTSNPFGLVFSNAQRLTIGP